MHLPDRQRTNLQQIVATCGEIEGTGARLERGYDVGSGN